MKEKILKIQYRNTKLSISTYLRNSGEEWIVCLHGLQSNKNLFQTIFNIKELNQYSILAIDFVGFGNSDKPTNFSYKIEDQVEICKKIFTELRIHKSNIIGHSLGGMIGTLLLNDKVNSFINLEGNFTKKDCGTSAKVSALDFQEFKKTTYQKLILKLENSNEEFEKIRSNWIKQIPDFAFYQTSHSIIEWSKSEKLLEIFNQFKGRKLYICGEKNSSKTNILEKETPKKIIKKSGHFMILENSHDTYQEIVNFLTTT